MKQCLLNNTKLFKICGIFVQFSTIVHLNRSFHLLVSKRCRSFFTERERDREREGEGERERERDARRKTQDILLNKQYMFISRGILDYTK